MDHRIAYSAFAYGTITIILFLSPIFIYGAQYSEQEKQGRGHVNGGDILGIVMEGMGIHVGISFFMAVVMGAVNLAFRDVPSLSPGAGLEHFYLMGLAPQSDFIQHWMDADWVGASATVSPLADDANAAFSFGMKAWGLVLTTIYIILPLIIVGLSLKYALGGKEDMRDESGINRIMGAVGFFIGATFLMFIHSFIASGVVMFSSNITDFSFFHSINYVWEKLLFKGS